MPVRSLTRGEDRGSQALHGAQCICAPGRQGQQERRHALCGQTRADNGHRHLRADSGGHPIRENNGVDGGADAAHDGSHCSHHTRRDANVALVGDLNRRDDDGHAVRVPDEDGPEEQQGNGLPGGVLVASGHGCRSVSLLHS